MNEKALILEKARDLIIDRNYCVSRIKKIKQSLEYLTEELDRVETELAELQKNHNITYMYDEENDKYLVETLGFIEEDE